MSRIEAVQAVSSLPRVGTHPPIHDDPAQLIGLPCVTPASFSFPLLSGVESGWTEHAPFAFWLIEALRPKVLVELGTHKGYSYSAFCQAVQSLHLDARCYAVDTWCGDEQAGFYDDSVYETFKAFHDKHYLGFSTLIRSTFDEALSHFGEGSIDLLHIDGRHFYDDVAHDFHSWVAKLSANGIVLFHDTNVRESGFGVYRLWAELKSAHPHFEFLHGHGLGVLAMGEPPSEALRRLFALTDHDEAGTTIVRAVYGRLGKAIVDQSAAEQGAALASGREGELKRAAEEAASLRELASARDGELKRAAEEAATLRELASARDGELKRAAEEAASLRELASARDDELKRAAEEAVTLRALATSRQGEIERASHHVAAVEAELELSRAKLAEARAEGEARASELACVRQEARLAKQNVEIARKAWTDMAALNRDMEWRTSLIKRELRQLTRELGEMQAARTALDYELGEAQAVRSTLTHELGEARAARLKAEDDCRAAQDRSISLDERCQAAELALDAVLRSTTWRATYPVRKLLSEHDWVRRSLRIFRSV